jgi:hypothetical protein
VVRLVEEPEMRQVIFPGDDEHLAVALEVAVAQGMQFAGFWVTRTPASSSGSLTTCPRIRPSHKPAS